MHGADRNLTARRFNVLVEHLEWQLGLSDCSTGTVQLGIRADEYAEFMGHHPFPAAVCQPCSTRVIFLVLTCESSNCRSGSIKHRYCAPPILGVTVYVRYLRSQQPVSLHSDLMRSAVVDVQGARAATDI